MAATLEKAQLKRVLDFLKPALSPHEFVPILSNFCFTEDGAVYAYDDVVGVTVREHDFGIIGALPGKDLLKVISSFPKSEITISEEDDGNSVLLKAGRSRTKMALMSEEEFVYKPDLEQEPLFEMEVDQELIVALKMLMVGIGGDNSSPAQTGVTFTQEALYTTDNITITSYALPEPIENIEQIIVPKSFCDLVCDLSKFNTSEVILLQFYEDSVVAMLEDESVEITTKLVADEEPFDFQTTVEGLLSEADEHLVKLPTEMKDMFERAEGIFGKNEESALKISFQDGLMIVDAKNEKIQFEDQCDFDGNKVSHCLADADKLNRACSFTTKAAFLPSVMAFTDGDGFSHFVCYAGE